jgi:hypothetical protein
MEMGLSHCAVGAARARMTGMARAFVRHHDFVGLQGFGQLAVDAIGDGHGRCLAHAAPGKVKQFVSLSFTVQTP